MRGQISIALSHRICGRLLRQEQKRNKGPWKTPGLVIQGPHGCARLLPWSWPFSLMGSVQTGQSHTALSPRFCCPCLSAFPGQSGLFHSLEWWSSPWPLELCVSTESDVPTGRVGLMLMVASILNNYNIIVNSRHHLNSLSWPCLSNLFVLIGLRIL